jgi:tyrosine-protein kinase Etk/Wzc
MNEEFATFHDYVDVIYRKKWLIVMVFVCVFLTTLIFVQRQPQRYSSVTTLYLEYASRGVSAYANSPIVVSLGSSGGSLGGSNARPLEFYLGVFDSRSVRDAVRRNLVQYAMDVGMDRQEASGLAVDVLRPLSIAPGRHEGYYSITVEASSPDIAYAADSIASYLFIERCKGFARHEFTTMEEFLDITFDSARVALLRAENALQSFREQHNLIEVKESETNPGLPVEYLRLLEGYYDARRERQTAQATLAATAQAAELIEQSYDSLAMDQVLRAVPAKDLAEVRERARNARTELRIKEYQEQDFKKQLEQYERAHPELPTISLTYMRLVREREIYGNLTNQLLERREELRVQAAAESGGLKVIDAPTPGSAMPSRARVTLILGIVIGLVFGISVAFFWEFIDPNIKTTAEIPKVLGVAAMGTIPSIGTARSRRRDGRTPSGRRGALISESNPKDPVAEAYRTLRTSIMYSAGDHRLRSFVISSSGQSEGKSVTTANLGITCAQMGQKTVIVDGDLRRPVQHVFFDLERDAGLTEYVLQDLPLSDVAKPSGIQNLDIITAGITPPNPAPLLASQGMRERLEELKAHYDLIVIDSPPIIAVTDAVLLGKLTEGILMVVRCAATPRMTARHAVSVLANAKVTLLGAIFNDVDVTRHYGGYYYYHYYYHYYYGGYYGRSPDDKTGRAKKAVT